MKNITLLIITLFTLSCKAQTLPLNTALNDIPNNAHVKDLNNELDSYVGIYKANFQGDEITLFITKVLDKPEKSYKKDYFLDALVVKYIIKNSSGTILQDTKNNTLDYNELYSIGTKSSQNSVILSYSGTNCGVGWGKVILKKLNATQISWEYLPNDIIIDSNDCPNGTDLKIYLPETKDLIFTKQ